MTRRRAGGLLAAVSAAVLAGATVGAMRPLPDRLDDPPGDVVRAEVVDRRGQRLAVTYQNEWNHHDRIALHEVPALLRTAIIEAEDRRFFRHVGVDWRARGAALWQNLRAGRVVRGASTLSEQVVRMLHPRPRTPWSRWIEGFEASALERRFAKGEILAFYLNQVPYARNRRGVAAAARDLFDRDLSTLSRSEILALAVLVRSPSGLDPRRAPQALQARMRALAARLVEIGTLSPSAAGEVARRPLELQESRLPVAAPAFVAYARDVAKDRGRIETTLDARLQARVQRILDAQVTRLAARGVRHGATLVVDHERNEVLVWVNASSESRIDAVRTPRQPGSTLKPFVYALALEQGWTAATLIEDRPTMSPVGSGLHQYRNYSGGHSGPLRLRVALASSLNVPAVRTMQSLPPGALHRRLRELGFASLVEHAAYYGEGLALGNGEVTLYELVVAYAVLARGGVAAPVHVLREGERQAGPRRRPHFDPAVANLIADILADADAREPEFGRGGVLDLPIPAAVKTGTSNDHRDAWAVGFSHRYTVGVWLGDLQRRPMQQIAGATGPAVALRGVFAELHRFEKGQPLALSPRLRRVPICAVTGSAAGARCPSVEEWFRPGHVPPHECPLHGGGSREPEARWRDAFAVELVRPTPGLHMAMDPRIPDELEVFEFALETEGSIRNVEWIVDGEPRSLRRLAATSWEWPLVRGPHRVSARVHFVSGEVAIDTPVVQFLVR